MFVQYIAERELFGLATVIACLLPYLHLASSGGLGSTIPHRHQFHTLVAENLLGRAVQSTMLRQHFYGKHEKRYSRE